MLQSNNTQSEISTKPAASAAEAFESFTSFARRQYPVIVFVTVLAIALGIIYLTSARPSFTAEAKLLIDAPKVQIFQQQSILADIPIDTAQVESQIEILKSENIASAVVKTLHLTEDPEFVGSGGGLLGALFSFIHSQFGADPATSEFELGRRAIKAFQSQLSIKRVFLSYVIKIDFQSYDPGKAAQVANEIADAYIVDKLEAKYQATRRASVWLQDRIKELRDQVSIAERAVVEFKAEHNIVSTGGTDRPLLNQQQVAELSSQLVIAREHSAEAKARLDRINSVLKADLPNTSFGETVADTLRSDVVSKLRSQYLELAAREAVWSAKYGHEHLAVVGLRTQMREIRNSIFDELKRLGETYKSEYEIAKQREDGVQKELAQAVSKSQETDTASVSLRELESTAQTYKTLYDSFLQRYMESVQQQSFPITDARLISSASRPLQKSDPKDLVVLAIAGLGGIMLGFGIGILRDLSDRAFRTSEQVESLLEADCIALVPLIGLQETRYKPSDPKTKVGPNNNSKIDGGRTKIALSPQSWSGSTAASPRTIMRSNDVIWTVVDEPLSRFTEAIRSIKLAADLNQVIKANRVIGSTSSLPDEGKSTIAVSLALLMAQVSARTILVDCDLRNPSLSRALAPDATSGLLEVIAGKASLKDAVWIEPSTNMAFLPAVVRSRLAHSSEILGSVPIKKLFEQLREGFDYVVIDLPPLEPIVDVRAMTHLVDSFIFTIEWGRTKIDIVKHAFDHAQGVRDNLLGMVLNKVDMNVFGRYASHRESYYNEHYARYGHME
jgi:succinoglycan biosynthesis transport protein ExoP